MKRSIYVLLIALMILAFSGCANAATPSVVPAVAPTESATAQTPEPTKEPAPTPTPDLRNVRWGMSKSEVMAIETDKLMVEGEKTILYETKVNSKSMNLYYGFNDNDQLCQATFELSVKHTNDNDYISDYDDLKNTLSLKHGKPELDTDVWKNDLYKDSRKDWGFAASIGHYSKTATWDNDKSSVILVLMGDNYDILVGILYSSKQIEIPDNTTSGL